MWSHAYQSASSYHQFSSSQTWKHLLHKFAKLILLSQRPGTECNIFAKSFYFSFPKPKENVNHRRPRSQVPAFRCGRAQRARCIRVSLLYKVFPLPGASWRARLLDNYPQEYQKSSSKQDNKPTNARRFSSSCVWTVHFQWLLHFTMNPLHSPVLPPRARAWEGAQKERA